MATSSSLFGWDLIYNSVVNDIKNNDDVLVCLTHLVMISQGFQCIGLGDSKNIDGTENKSESLPKGWNDNYRLRYLHQGRLYNLQATRLDDAVIINLIRVDERNVSMIQLNSRAVVQRTGSLDQMIPNNAEIIKVIRTNLINKVTQSTKTREGASQTPREDSQRARTSDSYSPRRPESAFLPTTPVFNPLNVGVGRNDLDPLAGIAGPGFGGFGMGPDRGIGPLGPGGGGMLFQPTRFDPDRQNYPGLPSGSVPPGARFDPFRPPDVDRFPRPRRPAPDNDEMPPPGFDDMYM